MHTFLDATSAHIRFSGSPIRFSQHEAHEIVVYSCDRVFFRFKEKMSADSISSENLQLLTRSL